MTTFNNENIKELGIVIPDITSEEINRQVVPVLKKMEMAGIKLDCAILNDLNRKLSKRLSLLEKKIYELAGIEFNIASPIQMSEVLFQKLKLSVTDIRKTKNGLSTAASELNKLLGKHKIIEPILEHRELSKLLNTYLKPLPLFIDKNSRLHTTFGLETSTGRLTSSEPNLQNIPIKGRYGEELRKAFIAENGSKLIVADYSQIELRVVASIANDKKMIEAFRRNEDIHTKTASEIFQIDQKKVTKDQRRIAKAVNFGIVYGQTPYGLSQALNIEVEKAAEYILHYFEIYRGIKDYINKTIVQAKTEGYVETIFGNKRYLPNINSHNRYIAEQEERMAINSPVQGTAAEILKLAMIKLDKELLKAGAGQMILTVHDELIVEVSEDKADRTKKIVKDVMENIVMLPVPIEVEVNIGNNWAEAK